MSNPYAKGLEFLCAGGVIKPLGKRVLLKAILATDGARLHVAGEDTAKAACHQVVDIGADVTKTSVGRMCLHISTASDAADFDKWENKSARYLFCHEDDIIADWDHEQAIKLYESL